MEVCVITARQRIGKGNVFSHVFVCPLGSACTDCSTSLLCWVSLTPSPDMVNLFHFDLTEQGLSPKTCSNYVAHTNSKRAVFIWLKCLLVWSLFTINNFPASRSPTYLGGPDTHRKKKPRTSDILEIFSKISIILSLQDRSRHCEALIRLTISKHFTEHVLLWSTTTTITNYIDRFLSKSLSFSPHVSNAIRFSRAFRENHITILIKGPSIPIYWLWSLFNMIRVWLQLPLKIPI